MDHKSQIMESTFARKLSIVKSLWYDYLWYLVFSSGASDMYRSAQCVQNCQMSMMNAIQRYIPDRQMVEKLSRGSVYNTLNETNFDLFCDNYKPGKQCLEKCPDSMVKEGVITVLSPVTRVCIEQYSEFKQYLPCFSNLANDVRRNCGQKCGNEEDIQSRMRSQVRVVNSQQDVRRMQATMNEACSFMACRGDCEAPLVEQKCGAEAQDLTRGFMAFTVGNLKQTFSKLNATEYWPASCEAIVQSGAASVHFFLLSLLLPLLLSFLFR